MDVYAMVMCILVFVFVTGSVIKPLVVRIPDSWKNITVDFSLAPIVGVILLLISQAIDYRDIRAGIIGNESVKPWQIIILFFSLAYICVTMDSSGIYSYLALKAVGLSKGSGRKLFFAFFGLSSIFTVFTSNDIVILTLTPIIAYFTKHTKVDPHPYLFAQFFASNIWSTSLYIGNPTNIIVGEAFKIPFVEYSAWSLGPAVASGFTSLVLLWVIFRKRIPYELQIPDLAHVALKSKFDAIFGLSCLFTTLLLLSLSGRLGISIWIITLVFALVMFIKDVINDFLLIRKQRSGHILVSQEVNEELKQVSLDETVQDEEIHKEISMDSLFHDTHKKITWRTGNAGIAISKLPWKIVPFVLGMFILVASLQSSGWIELFAKGMAAIIKDYVSGTFIVCFLSAIVCNLINNQPMTILFTQVMLHPAFDVSPTAKQASIYALIYGSNFGANFTLIGALAGIMWNAILDNHGIKVSYLQFAKYGALVTPFVIVSCCVVYVTELSIFGH